MSDNQKWRCPECDTWNTEDKCLLCGEKRPVVNNQVVNQDTQSNGNSPFPGSKPQNSIKNKILYVVSICLAMLISATVSAIIVKNYTRQKCLGQLEMTQSMNNNAQVIYSSSLDYCIKSKTNDKALPTGFYTFEIKHSDEKAIYNGTQADLEIYFSGYFNADYTQYCAFYVNNGLPIVAYWSTDLIKNDVANIDQEQIVNENRTLGVYPAAIIDDTVYTYIDNAPQNQQIDIEENANISDGSKDGNAEDEAKTFESDKLCAEILKCINADRESEGIYKLTQSERSKNLAEMIHAALENGTYEKGMFKDEQSNLADYSNFYFEKEFDISDYSSEAEIARELLDYEKENFSSNWMKQVHQYYYATASFKGDTACVVFTMIGDKKASIGNESYERELTELDLNGKNLTPADISSLPYFYNLEVLKLDDNSIPSSDVFSKLPKLHTLWLDNNGVTDISFLKGCSNLKVVTLNDNQIKSVEPFESMVQLEKIYIVDNDIEDLTPLYKLTNLTELDIRENRFSSQELKALSDVLSQRTNITSDS